MREDDYLLRDILEAIDKIEKHASRGRDVFEKDELVQVWVVHHIQIIGEAASRLSVELRERCPAIPWADIVAMRNVLVHHYFGIDLNQVWDTVTIDLPRLKRDIEKTVHGQPEVP